ncbi:hypothetical protein [Rhizobium hidalgonense]|uniref:hypothetical protein n=1 Tax=Rhizobium hidalgonense TaxID=1538159 RepID=UPI000BE97D4A|nr:hypothetical protein [Rhizobium hidalgonense]
MTDTTSQQVILRKEGSAGPSSSEMAEKVGRAGAVVIDEKPSTLLVEGNEETLRSATESVTGWKAIPMKRYSLPDTRKKIGW